MGDNVEWNNQEGTGRGKENWIDDDPKWQLPHAMKINMIKNSTTKIAKTINIGNTSWNKDVSDSGREEILLLLWLIFNISILTTLNITSVG